MTSGLQEGDLIIVAGRPSMGKTAFALNMAEHVAVAEKRPVAVFSMEMSGTQIAGRMLGAMARIDQHKLRTGRLTDEDWSKLADALGKLHEAPIHIDETGSLNPLELRSRARRLARQYGKLGLIVVDYLQLMVTDGKREENRATELSEISRSLKALAKELAVPVVALSQLNRSVDSRPDKRPIMSDLRESGALEQDADVILFIYREVVYNRDAEAGKAEIIIAKQRNGPIGDLPLTFLGQYTRFENYAAPGSY
jgi:replicative DNA helicase